MNELTSALSETPDIAVFCGTLEALMHRIDQIENHILCCRTESMATTMFSVLLG
jgi:hypothetical protein